MKMLLSALWICFSAGVFSACRSEGSNDQATGNAYQAPGNQSSASSPSSQTPPVIAAPTPSVSATPAKSVPAVPKPNQGLTGEQVKVAVAALLSDWRLGGNVSVKGVQELPQQNSAVADLQFEQFEYAVTYAGELIKAAKFKPPVSKGMIPSPEAMFPPRKVFYRQDGKAILSHYSDGRWTLKEVRWGFDKGVKGNIEIR